MLVDVRQDTAAWFERSLSRWTDWPPALLRERKAGHRVSVVIPARNEEETIGDVVRRIRHDLLERTGLVDELVVMDSDSVDKTALVAAECGADVYAARDVRPDIGWFPGKGEALWKSLFVTTGDILVFIDADLTDWGPHFVSGLLGPLLSDDDVDLVKGFYDRLLEDDSTDQAPQGGRVTELVARPLLNLCWPGLSAVVQPLAGEWAVRRRAVDRLPIPTGYGIETSVLLDTYHLRGLDAIAQVDLGERGHRHQSVHDLGVMAAEILHVALQRAFPAADKRPGGELWQFDRSADPPWRSRHVPLSERPPARDVEGYRRC